MFQRSVLALSARRCRRATRHFRLVVDTAYAGVVAPYHALEPPANVEEARLSQEERLQAAWRKFQWRTAVEGLARIGEDACFVTPPSAPQDASSGVLRQAFGVADGVGGWRQQGVDAGLVSHNLMAAALSLFGRKQWPEGSPRGALQLAHEAVLLRAAQNELDREKAGKQDEEASPLMGSCTALLGLVEDGKLHAANLGDSGLLLVSATGEDKLRTVPQTSMGGVFNCPSQLAVPAAIAKDYPAASTADEYSAELAPGDVLLAATDGFWDNIHPEQLKEFIEQWRAGELAGIPKPSEQGGELTTFVSYLCHVTARLSTVPDFRSPFEVAAAAAGVEHRGGKVDDCTLVLGVVRELADDDTTLPSA